MKKNIVKKLLIMLAIIICTAILVFSGKIEKGIESGIGICLNTIIPSLYIFTVMCVFIINSDLFAESKIFSMLSKLFFGFGGNIGTVSLLSQICGYPIGAKLINELYAQGKITKSTAQSMLNYCINPGPAFVITVVGEELYKNHYIGIFIFLSSVISSIICSVFCRKNICNIPAKSKVIKQVNYTYSFLNAVNSANRAILSICGWVLLSNALVYCIDDYEYLKILSSLIEVTTGVIISAKNYSVFFTAFLVGFGGISVHMQALSAAKDFCPKYSIIFLWKSLQGLLTALFTFVFFKIFPQLLETAALPSFKVASKDGTVFTSITVIIFIICTFIFSNKKIKSYGKNI